MEMSGIYDYVIIGAGLAGVVTGALLAKQKIKVAILEKNTKCGGYIQNLNIKAPYGAHHIGIPDKELFFHMAKKLDVDFDKYLVQADQVLVELYEKKYSLSLELTEQEKQLIQYFPEEKINISSYINYMQEFADALYADDGKTIKKFFIKLTNCSFKIFLKKFFENETLIKLMTFLGPAYGGVSEYDSAFTFASLIATYGNGAYYFNGERFICKMEKVIADNPYAELIRNYRCNKLRYDKMLDCYEIYGNCNQVIKGKKIIFASYFTDILKEYCEYENIENKVLNKIFQLEVGPSAYRIYFKLDKKLDRNEFIHIGNFENILLADKSYILSTLENDECGAMLTVVVNEKEFKMNEEQFCKEAMDIVANTLEIEAGNIRCIAISTPKDKFIKTGNKQGAVFGWKRNKQNNLNANLIYSMNKIVKDIYIVGNWSATFGVFGVFYTVNKLCNEIINKE